MAGKTTFEKIWDDHVVKEREDGEALLYVDRMLIHDLHYRRFDALAREGKQYAGRIWCLPRLITPCRRRFAPSTP